VSVTGSAPERGRVELRRAGRIAWITLDRPARLNAFAGTMRDDLHDALEAAGSDREVRAIVVHGAGRAFCAGADVDTMEALLEQGDADTFAGYVDAGARVVRQIRALGCPVVAAVNGVAAGAGASLAAACDLRIAAASATIGFTFNRIGLHPDWGATYTLPRLVGAGRAMELIVSARMLDSAEAERIGLFDRVVADADFADAVAALAEELAARPSRAIAAAKRSLAQSFDSTLDEMLGVERGAQLDCFAGDDVREGIRAFRERRAPRFTDS
jgi:2-(1,2-epoxy-1,2-dihydrophenyl)acetyl-CoA isomerase